jgi:hypothetical protein
MDRRKSITFEGIVVEYPAEMDDLKLAEILKGLIDKVRGDHGEPHPHDPASTIGLKEALDKKKDLPP